MTHAMLAALLAALLSVLGGPALAQKPQAPKPAVQKNQAAPSPAQDFPMPRPLSQGLPRARERLAALAAAPHTPETVFAAGVLQAAGRQWAEAALSLAPVAERQSPLTAWARFYRGFARYRLGDFRAALADFDTIDPADPALGQEALLLQGYCLEALNDPQAAGRYRRFLDAGDNPLRAAALLRLGALAAQAGDNAAAEAALAELLRTLPWTASAEKGEPLARELRAKGLIAFDPDDPSEMYHRADLLLNRSMAAKARPLISALSALPAVQPGRALYLEAKSAYIRRDTAAAVQLYEDAARAATDPLLALWAQYHQARAMWRFSGPDDAARMEDLLQDVLVRGAKLPGSGELLETSRRLLLLLRLERGRFPEALEAALQLEAQAPAGSSQARTQAREQAVWLAGLIRFALADYQGAAKGLEAFAAEYPDSDFAPAAAYWRARAAQAAGNAETARQGLARVLERWPNGYYGMLARERLAGTSGAARPDTEQGSQAEAAPGAASDQPEAKAGMGLCAPDFGLQDSGAVQGLARAEALLAAQLPELAERELGALNAASPQDAALALRYARLASEQGNHGNAVRALGRALGPCLARGTPEELRPLRDIFYPSRYAGIVDAQLAGTGVDPAIIRGLIRQESFFEPDAVSGAGAVGLMQVLPSTAASLAAKNGERTPGAESLKDPAVNIRFGVRYFLERYNEYGGNLPLTLSSYNAGRVKVGVWREFLGGLDRELFTEFIPYTETRDYVKRILGNQAMYRLLY
ncbi:lytic transglycosylase domain-containing protein [Fundidesulfovibrio agrisoli]|uniref:lytic transglycosylase domain-containing protein n=1 Tax=Fundidesulfovibrio agrisoli TaxID=2922717 RepID=UPI001FAE144F|nr:lytic transglycosylase domain-containing protein [Fundidesulfovibrio agrisoli]